MKFLTLQENDEVDLAAQGGIADQVHVFEKDQIRAINAALGARRPLLVSGEPGAGKSQLARAAARALERAFVSFVVDSQSEARDLAFELDAIARLGEAQLSGALRDSSAEESRQRLAIDNFLHPAHSTDAAAALFAADAETIRALGRIEIPEAADGVDWATLDDRPVMAASQSIAQRAAEAQKVLDADPTGRLRSIRSSASEIISFARRRAAHTTLVGTVGGERCGASLLGLVSAASDCVVIPACCDFVRSVRTCGLPAEVVACLLGADGEQHLVILQATAANAVQAREALVQAARAFENRSGLPAIGKIPDELPGFIERVQKFVPALRSFLAITPQRKALVDLGLEAFLTAAEGAKLPPEQMELAFERALLLQRATRAAADATLAGASGLVLKNRRQTFAA